ncbi:MAG: TetR/AcrR family transcriptional regulator [Gammaproteobacteria bacterium]|nr:TetR/AcrR family transcriptional regulator [Gammaproteobacteria bacterium]
MAKAGKDLRREIALGLQKCIVEKGWAATKLNDIAAKAELVPSHVRYYFPNKEEMLTYRFAELCDEFAFRVYLLDRSSPIVWFQQFGYLAFNENPRWKEVLLVLMEMNVAVFHSERMSRIKVEADQRILREFEDQLSKLTLAANLTPSAAAQLAFATMMGLMTNEVFESGPSVAEARSLFFASLESITGLQLTSTAVPEDLGERVLRLGLGDHRTVHSTPPEASLASLNDYRVRQ